MSPKPPVSPDQGRAFRDLAPLGSSGDWSPIPEGQEDEPPQGFLREHAAVLVLGGALVLALSFLGLVFWGQFGEVKHELDQTKLALATANGEIGRMQGEFARASVIHDLWGMGSQFASASSGACSADDDQNKVRAATAAAIEMWSDSEVRAEINVERTLLPVLRGLREQGIQIVGAELPAGVVAQYRRFRREGVGFVVMLDPSRIVDTASREGALELLRRAGEGRLDPSKSYAVFRHDEYGEISYPIVQGPEDSTLLTVKLSNEPLAAPATIGLADFPCS